MLAYTVRRIFYMTITLILISMIAFTVIQLPPGSYLTTYLNQLQSGGTEIDEALVASLVQQFGLDQPIYVQYWKWVTNIVTRGDFGISFAHNRPVSDLIRERLPLTLAISVPTTILVYLVSIPIGIYSALRQYSIGDYALSVVGFVGLAVPNFLLALLLMYLGHRWFGANVGGLFSAKYEFADWSMAKFFDLLSNIWVPIVVVGMAGTAGLIRVMRGMLLDELSQPYVETARAKGLSENKLVYKYPVRIAISPILSTVGYTLPALVSGEAIVAIVLNLPTIGPLLLSSLLSQDMYLAGSLILILSVMTVVGTFLSDVLLAWADPRIRYG
jgi:peptide/nickel transport system permease protein